MKTIPSFQIDLIYLKKVFISAESTMISQLMISVCASPTESLL